MRIFSRRLLYTVPYKQQWSEQQPAQHDTPVPLDHVGLKTGVVYVEQSKAFEYINAGSDSVGLTTGVVGAVQVGAYQYTAEIQDSVGLTTGLVSVVEENI